MKKQLTVYNVAYLSVYVALMIALTFIPYTGYITIGPVAITTIPVFISIATWHLGWLGGITTSLTFGIGSYLAALVFGGPLFINYPEIAIVPRFLLGIFISFTVQLLGKIKFWKVTLTSGLAVLGNTMFVTAWYFLMKEYRNADDLGTFKVWIYAIYVNFFVEFGVGLFIGIATYKLTVYLKQKNIHNKAIRY